ncbi:50S ribosomal protein L22 [Nanoarchaeota archaeon]
MGDQKYAAKIEGETAKVIGRDLSISTKHSVEVCRALRGKNLQKAKEFLRDVIEKKAAVPYRRYNDDLGHKKGKVGPGRYPIKTCKAILGLLESVETNAQFKGLNTSFLEVVHICAHLASRPWHFGRKTREKMKRSHVEIIVKEGKRPEAKKEEKKKTETKKETKPTTKGSDKK